MDKGSLAASLLDDARTKLASSSDFTQKAQKIGGRDRGPSTDDRQNFGLGTSAYRAGSSREEEGTYFPRISNNLFRTTFALTFQTIKENERRDKSKKWSFLHSWNTPKNTRHAEVRKVDACWWFICVSRLISNNKRFLFYSGVTTRMHTTTIKRISFLFFSFLLFSSALSKNTFEILRAGVQDEPPFFFFLFSCVCVATRPLASLIRNCHVTKLQSNAAWLKPREKKT